MTQQTARRFAWAVWALCPVFVLAWLAGPGSGASARSRAAAHAERAELAARTAKSVEEWNEVRAELGSAIGLLEEEQGQASIDARRRLRFELAKASVQAGDLWNGVDAFGALLDECEEADSGDDAFARSVRHELATTHYFAAWLMRLEGGEEAEWRPEAQTARQHFRLLAEAKSDESSEGRALRENLEAVVRLERMDLQELRSLPLPKNCSSNCSGLCQSRSNCKGGRCQGKDGRKKINKSGAGATRASGSGS